jgi:hypothetical protein
VSHERAYSHYERLVRSAEVSECGLYRYWLRRAWQTGGNGKVCCFVMLNPSKADALQNDPTITRCMNFVKAWGYSVLDARNLFAFRATDPAEMRRAADRIGPKGLCELAVARTADLVIAAWGASNFCLGPDAQAMELLGQKPVYCLALTKHARPQHPLFVRASAVPLPFNDAAKRAGNPIEVRPAVAPGLFPA